MGAGDGVGRARRIDAAQRIRPLGDAWGPAVRDDAAEEIRIGSDELPSLPAAIAIVAPIAGAAIYWLFIWHLTGNPFQWSGSSSLAHSAGFALARCGRVRGRERLES
jgi:hypothetical protein